MILSIETVGGASVSSGSWGEDSYYALAGAVHSHVASPVLISEKPPVIERPAAFCIDEKMADNFGVMSDAINVPVSLGGFSHSYEISVGHDVLSGAGAWARGVLPAATAKIAIVSNPKVFGLYGETVRQSLGDAGFDVVVFLMKDGERHKNMRSLSELLGFIGANKLSRTDAVLALGGGVVGDLAGFAAGVFLRGIAFLQVPTTLLSMIDSSVGGKTGVNTDFGKNLVGAFHQPNGVLIDVGTLATLPRRELVAGFCEAVKHGAISSPELFDQTAEFLKSYRPGEFKKFFGEADFVGKLEALLAAQVAFKASIVMGDEREEAARSDAKSRKILNFGHTLGHALEKVTNYRYFKHGEAVGYGILFAAELSKSLEILDANGLNLLRDVVNSIGTLPKLKNIDLDEVVQAFSFDKKNIGRSLQFILLEGIGRPVLLTNVEITETHITNSLKRILH